MLRMDDYNKGLIYTEIHECIDCNKCIHGCPALKANVNVNCDQDGHKVCVDDGECVLCGKCLDTCLHDARHFRDDTDSFFSDLARGKEFSVIVAPSLYLNYPDEYQHLFGYLKSLGVKNFYSATFGVEITTWAYIKYMLESGKTGFISQPCPSIVSYIQTHSPELLSNLMPIQSPMMATAIYLKKYMGITENLVFLSPCIAKKIEIQSKRGLGLIDYNVTFNKLMEFIKNRGVNLSGFEAVGGCRDFGGGSTFPTPGGLKENIRHYLGIKPFIVQVEGERRAYEYLKSFAAKGLKDRENAPLLTDILNCQYGCMKGTGTVNHQACENEINYQVHLMRQKKRGDETHSDPKTRLADLNEKFKDIDINDFMCEYSASKPNPRIRMVSDDEIESIFREKLVKLTGNDQHVDCSACGYDTCRHMAEAIALGINTSDNCVYYVKSKLIEHLKQKTSAETILRAILDSMPLVANVLNSELKIIECNAQALHLFGLKDVNEYSERFYELHPKFQPCGTTSAQKIDEYNMQVVEDGYARFEWIHQKLDGEPIPCEITLMRFNQNNEMRVFTFITDRRDFFKYREAVQTMENRLTSMLNASPIICAIFDENLNIIEANQAAATLFGLEDKQMYVDHLFDLCPDYQPCGTPSRDKARQMIKYVLKEGKLDFEWIHCYPGKEVMIPCEVFMQRAKIGDKYVVVTYVRDVREQHAILELKAAEQELMEAIVNSNPLVCMMFDKDFNCIRVNRKVVELFGVASEEEYLKDVLAFSPKLQPDGADSRHGSDLALQEAFEKGIFVHEWWCQDVNGNIFPTEETLERVQVGNEYYVLSYLRDLRHEYKVKELQEAEKERVYTLLDSSPLVCAIFDENHNGISVNRQAVDFFEIPDKQVYLDDVTKLMPEFQPDGSLSAEKSKEVLSAAFKAGYARYEWMYQTMSGVPIPCEETIERVNFGGDDLMLVYTRDISEQYVLRQMQEREHERIQAMLDSSPMGCSLIDSNFNVISTNQKTVELFKLPSKQVLFNETSRFYPEKQPCGRDSVDLSKECFLHASKVGYARYEWLYIDYFGAEIPCEETLVSVEIGDERFILCYVRDLREEKAIMAELKDAIDREQLANQAKTRFLARMSHEIRTPMNSVLGVTELELQKDIHPPDTEDAFMRIYESSNLLLALINDILDLSKVEAGKLEIVNIVYETASMIIDTVQLNLMYIGSKNIKFKLEVDENLPAYMVGDELRIKQILNNILSNAFKYTNSGSVILSFSSEYLNDDNTEIVIKVTDTGQGMSEDDIQGLYGEFSRFNVRDNYTVEGTGLGLSITQKLVDMMNGRIDVDSQVSVGTTFTVRLPQKVKGKTRIGRDTAQSMQNLDDTQRSLKRLSKLERELMPYGRVLLVDDVESNLYVAKGFLMPYKLQVETAHSGFACIEKIKSGSVYDIIFMDHMMPEMDGMETTKILREMGYNHPIVALTANALTNMAEVFLQNGFNGYTSKPIDINQLDKYLMRFIHAKQPDEVIEKARLAKPAADATEDGRLSDLLVQSFIRDAKKALVVLVDFDPYVPEDKLDLSNYIIQTHAMRSALHNVGQKDASKKAGLLEDAARAGDMAAIASFTPGLTEMIQAAIEELDGCISKSFDVDAQACDVELLKSQMQLIYDACENYEIDDAKAALKVLYDAKYPSSIKDSIDEIRDHLLGSDFEEAAALAAKLLND
ncbi:MAG: PAS domain S-box protein [Defluviitaleaceae bacterium]|nr:PAS domain S-box protein [Defluviitaleaceae bacterium]